LYKEIALALKGVEWRQPGLVAFASKLVASAAEHAKIVVEVPDSYAPKTGVNPWAARGGQAAAQLIAEACEIGFNSRGSLLAEEQSAVFMTPILPAGHRRNGGQSSETSAAAVPRTASHLDEGSCSITSVEGSCSTTSPPKSSRTRTTVGRVTKLLQLRTKPRRQRQELPAPRALPARWTARRRTPSDGSPAPASANNAAATAGSGLVIV
jgi:hypothetical protein